VSERKACRVLSQCR